MPLDQLLTLLRTGSVGGRGDAVRWAPRPVEECREALLAVLPRAAAEKEFFDRLLD